MSEGVDLKSRKQREAEEYLARIKLKEIFGGLLRHVIVHQPDDPISYFHEELTKIKKEVEASNIDVASSTFLTSISSAPVQSRSKN